MAEPSAAEPGRRDVVITLGLVLVGALVGKRHLPSCGITFREVL
jgi:hypothetical protein